MAEPVAFSCPECATHARTALSYCPACTRPFPLLKTAYIVPPAGVLKASERQPASPSNFEPLPAAVVRDLEAIRRTGKSERQGWLLVGESELILGIPVVGFAVCFVITVIFGILDGIFGDREGDYRAVFAIGFGISFAVGLILFLLAKMIKPAVYALLNGRAGGNRLLTDRRVFIYMAEEGLVWHDPFGLRFVPWQAIAAITHDPGTKDQPACLRFVDSRTNEVLNLHAALMFNGTDLRNIHAELLKRRPAA